MPLCKLEIPANNVSNNLRRTVQSCNTALDTLLKGLSVPDPEDREVAITRHNDLAEPRLVISYTVGPNEYPETDSPSFYPTEESVRKTGMNILDENGADLGIRQIVFEEWCDTTFVMPPTDYGELSKVEPTEIQSARVRLFLSPELREGAGGTKESETRQNPLLGTGEQVASAISESLRLSQVQTEIVWTEYADSEVSVEFDCEPTNGKLSEGARLSAAKAAEGALHQNIHTRDRESEIWIRQGKPKRIVVET